MNKLAYKISSLIKNTNPEETSSVEVMQYALNIILNSILIFLGTLLISWLLGNLNESIIFIIFFSSLRFLSGGFHLKTATACNIVTILLCTLTPYLITFPNNRVWIINLISLLIMFLFAPNPDKNAQIQPQLYPTLKILSIILVSLNFFISSTVIGLAFLVQSLTIIPLKRRIKS
ncbi:accessory gene regulator ArgB-like protein [Paenibacillus sp. GCM10012306]|uniref:accessory gene regulator ArgB-like protein n=1 Tax=Paenibacillus sp. GCM10012306 TaxID=3317342 RepID=UPI0036244A83